MSNQQNPHDEFGGFGESDDQTFLQVIPHHHPKKVHPKSPAQDLFLMYNLMFRLKNSFL